MMFSREVYGFQRSLKLDLERVRRVVQERLGIALEPHENSYLGAYFCWSKPGSIVRDVSVFENLEGENVYSRIFPDYSPLVEVQSIGRSAAEEIFLKLAEIPSLVVLKQSGSRRRSLGSDENITPVRFDLLVYDGSDGEGRSRRTISTPYRDLMSILALGADRDLVGVLKLSAAQTMRLCQRVGDLRPPNTGVYAIDLKTIEREVRVARKEELPEKIVFYDWAERPAITINDHFGWAVFLKDGGWESLEWPATLEILTHGIEMTAERQRDLFGELPPAPSARDHPDYEIVMASDEPD
jgi:hypothetical protein